jgi:hypothetical protein
MGNDKKPTVRVDMAKRRIVITLPLTAPITVTETSEPNEQCSDCGAEVLGHHSCQGVPGN